MSSRTTDNDYSVTNLTRISRNLRRTTANPSRISIVGALLLLGLLAVLHFTGCGSKWHSAAPMLILVVTTVIAWEFPRWRILVLALTATIVCYSTDLGHESVSGIELIAATTRMAVTCLFVIAAARARQELDNARYLARLDDLTGLPNRQAILEAIDAELCRARRFGRPFCVALLDCDGFKAINDQNGHLAGDHALQKLAAALRVQTRAYDSVGRLGGDEFVLILSEASADQSPAIIERLRTALQQELSHEYPSLSFSIGVTTIQPPIDPTDCVIDRFECLHRADQAMYAAKRSGTNQTRYSTGGESATPQAAETQI